jgi:hypothetical protein
MPISVGSIVDKISEARSKIAIYKNVMLNLRSNYLSSADSEAEMQVVRADYAPVPEAHIELAIADLTVVVEELEALLKQWENITVDMSDPAEAGKKKSTKKEKANAAAEGDDRNRTPAQ